MLLRDWIAEQGLTYQQAAKRLGYAHQSGLNAVVLGWTFPRPWRIRAILEGTSGAVTVSDIYTAWARRHPPGSYVKKEFERRR